jgi:tetratricopeptide (TPR) repeat protein
MSAGTAHDIAEQARSAAAAFPTDVVAQGYLAEAQYDAKNYTAAEAAADRALAIDPGSVQALIYKGKAKMSLGKTAPRSADWKQIRALFLKANSLDTENAEPLALFFESYAMSGEQPTKNAIDALLYAHELAPQDDDLRLTASRQLLLSNRLPEAKAMFATLAYTPHGEKKARATLTKIMAAIVAGDSKGAISLIDAKVLEDSKKR